MNTGLLTLLEAVAVAANECPTPECALLAGLRQVCRATGWSAGHVYRVRTADERDREGYDGERTLAPTGLWHVADGEDVTAFQEATARREFRTGEGLPGRVLATAAPAWVRDVAEDVGFLRTSAAQAVGIRGAIACPLLVGSEVVGVLECFSAGSMAPDDTVLAALRCVGMQLGRVVERAWAAADAARERERLGGLVELQQAIATAATGADAITHAVLDRILRLTGADGAAVVRRCAADPRGADPGSADNIDQAGPEVGGAIHFVTATGLSAALEGRTLALTAAPLAAECLRTGELRHCDDAEQDPWVNRDGCRRHGVRSVAYAPVRDGSMVTGAVAVVARRPAAFTGRELESLRLVAGLLSAAESRASAFATAQRVLAERTAALAALTESEARFAAFMDHTPAVAIVKDAEGRYVYANRVFETRFGLPLAEIRGRTDDEIRARAGDSWASPATSAALWARDLTVLASDGPAAASTETVPDPDGQERQWLVYRFPITDARDASTRGAAPGDARLLGIVAVDVTEQRRAVDELDRVFSMSVDMLCVAGFDGYFKRVNPAFTRTLGWSEAALLATPFLELTHPDDLAATVAELERIVRGPSTAAFLNRTRCKDGSYRWISWTSQPSVADGVGYVVARDVTEQKHAEEALRESEARYQRIAANAPGMVYQFVLRPDGTAAFPFVSDGCRQVYGVEPEAVRRDASVLLDSILPDDRPSFQHSVAESAARLQPWQWEGRVVLPSGEVRWIQGASRPERQPDGSILWDGLLMDVTERKQAEAVLRRQALTFETIHDAVIVTGPNGHILDWNPAATRMLGYTRDEALGRLPGFLNSGQVPDDLAHVTEVLAALERDGRWTGERAFRRKDGTEGVCETVVVPLRDGAGRVVSTIGVSRDITERKRWEQQLLQAQKLEAIGQLAAGIAHEINTPVQYVGDNVRFLQDGFERLLAWSARTEAALRDAAARGALGDPALMAAEADAARQAADVDYLAAEIPAAIGQSLEGVGRIAEIVRGMKALSHPGGGELVEVDLHAELDKTIAVARNEWKYVADVVTEYDPALPRVCCRVGEIHQVLLNLLVNAAHAVRDARPVGGQGRGTITVRTRADGVGVAVEIQDTGTGIPEAIRTRVFDPFFTTKEVGEGTGQGLAIAHRAVEKHGGTLTFDTQIGVGTTFVVRLPLRLPLGGAPAAREAA